MEVRESEISPQLHCMDRRESLNRLYLQNYLAVDYQVRSKSEIQSDVLVENRNPALANYPAASALKLVLHCYFVDGFKESRAEGRVNLVS